MSLNFLLSGILINGKLCCTMVKPDCLSLNVISATYRILGTFFNFSVPQFPQT